MLKQKARAVALGVWAGDLALTALSLPVAYALLGACAFALRNMAAQTGTKTYQPSYCID